MTRYITVLDKRIPLAIYVQAIKTAKANPTMVFKRGLTTWWPTTGTDVMRQFHEGMTDRINAAIPYIERGKA